MAASGSGPSAPSLAALPDNLLLACFEQLLEDPVERCAAPITSRWPPRASRGGEPATARRIVHPSPPSPHPVCRRRVLPLVCSRWRRLADSPQLVRSFSLKFKGASSLARLPAFRSWLERLGAGAAVRSLRLVARPTLEDHIDDYSTADLTQLRSELLCISAICSGLQELRVEQPVVPHDQILPDSDVDVSSLAGALPSLRLLHLLLQDTALQLQAPLDSQSQLLDQRL